jgi:LPXTG-site transpeptidase (sortase) family protein
MTFTPFSPSISLLRSTSLALCLFFVLAMLAQAHKPVSTPKSPPLRLVISKIRLDEAILPVGRKPIVVEGKTYTMWETADNEVGWHNLSALPGQVGNTVLSGHSDIKGRVFRSLKELQKGDEIQLFSADRAEPYRYVVTERIFVQEKGVSIKTRLKNARWIAPTQDERLTLVTCAYPGATHRLIIVARPVGEEA